MPVTRTRRQSLPWAVLLLIVCDWSGSVRRRSLRAVAGFSPSARTTQPRHRRRQGLSALGASLDRGLETALAYIDGLLLRDGPEVGAESDAALLRRVDALHADDVTVAAQSVFPTEPENTTAASPLHGGVPAHDWIEPFALRTREPVLDADAIRCIRNAAAQEFADGSGGTSRFTFQAATNAEAHVAELPDPRAIEVINTALLHKIYPLARAAFLNATAYAGNRMFVYDALVIRYNATTATPVDHSDAAASGPAAVAAGQPFHRDLGLVSVNIMLNPAASFQGGGTYFEDQTADAPLKPHGGDAARIGCALLHWAAARHAGAATTAGVRDVLVVFLSATRPVPALRAAWLKQCRDYCQETAAGSGDEAAAAVLRCRLRHHRLAATLQPRDGEALQYLGTALLEYAELLERSTDQGSGTATSGNVPPPQPSRPALEAAVACLRCARELAPRDARVCCVLAAALECLDGATAPASWRRHGPEVEQLYATGYGLLRTQAAAGCDVRQHMESLSLSYGLHLANQDRFAEAVRVLAPVVTSQSTSPGDISPMVQDARRLYVFCLQRQPEREELEITG